MDIHAASHQVLSCALAIVVTNGTMAVNAIEETHAIGPSRPFGHLDRTLALQVTHMTTTKKGKESEIVVEFYGMPPLHRAGKPMSGIET